MFLNFWLHRDLRSYCGVDLTAHFPEELEGSSRKVIWEVWTRPPMGIRPSPYQAVQGALIVKRLALGAPADTDNVFQWEKLDCNLPGDHGYRTGDPWISKRRRDGQIAADIHSYVDDERVTAPTRELAWAGSSKLAKLRAFLGLQDAARKRREPSQEPGPWAGVVVHSRPGEPVYKLITQSRWDKAKRILKEFTELYSREGANTKPGEDVEVWLPRKVLESGRGFLIYITRTYTTMIPYLKGLHLTIDSWQPNRDADGWKLPTAPGGTWNTPDTPDEAPAKVRAVGRLKQDLRVLEMLMQPLQPPSIPARPTATVCTAFMFGDASGTGFGQSLWLLGGEEIDIFHGLWDDEAAEQSSNWREFYNQVLGVERGLEKGTITKGTELFMFTDNFVTERAYFSGTSKSKTLFELILKLQQLEMKGELFIHLIWVAGTRMIEQGTDGVSRGDLVNGVMGGKAMLDFVPLNLGVYQRSPDLVEWIAEACGGGWKTLATEEWFHQVHLQEGRFIWSPAPAIADAALEQLCETRHTRPMSAHIFLCPALMTSRWRKRLGKVADAMFTVPVGSAHWKSNMHEPVVVALICPLLPCSPWQVRESPVMAQLQRNLPRVWSSDLATERDSLREFWAHAEQWRTSV
jgi:hypothetical protein